MNKIKQTITINGRAYDAKTGHPVEIAAPIVKSPVKAIHQPTGKVISDFGAPTKHATSPLQPKPVVHRSVRLAAAHATNKPQRSHTLRRDILKKPVSARQPSATKIHRRVERSQRISRFAPVATQATPVAVPQKTVDPELTEQAAVIQQAHAHHVKQQTAVHNNPAISSRAVKEHLLQKQLTNAPSHVEKAVKQARTPSRRSRLMSLATTSLALVLLGGYLTYINIPNLSIKVAAANAGIDATLPRYQPGGYAIRGPIAYSSGEVAVKYQQTGGDKSYKLLQKNSDWDPQATLENYVAPESNDDYQIHSAQGLTVYTYDKKAVWVNGGILHIIEGNAPLSNQQVEKIATSM